MYQGLIHAPPYVMVLLILVITHLVMVSTSVYLHRCLAHRALQLHPAASCFFRIILYLVTGTKVKEWVAVHRKHHANPDTAEDPHSPQVLGLAPLFYKGYHLYRRAYLDPLTVQVYGKGVPEDRLERVFQFFDRWPGMLAMLGLEILLFGWVSGVLIWIFPMALLCFCSNGLVNGLGHYWGYRNFDTPEAARNFCPIGILMAGEELHNNHHAYPVSAKFSRKWWEFDICWLYIRILAGFRLAKVRKE